MRQKYGAGARRQIDEKLTIADLRRPLAAERIRRLRNGPHICGCVDAGPASAVIQRYERGAARTPSDVRICMAAGEHSRQISGAQAGVLCAQMSQLADMLEHRALIGG